MLSLIISNFSFATVLVSNKDHSEIHFKIPYMQVSEVNGRFNDFTVEVNADEKGNVKGPLIVMIRTASIDTGNKMRDSHLERSDFFNASQYPKINFESDKITNTGGNYKAEGKLTIKGITKPATVNFTVTKAQKDTWGYKSIFVKFSSTVNRKDYNIVWNKTLDGQEFLVGNEVLYSGVVQLQPKQKLTPNSKHMIPDNSYIRQRDLDRQKNESELSQKIRNLINGKKTSE